LLEAWGQRFDLQLEDHLTVFRYRDVPGMIGRVGTAFGRHEINIVSAAVGRQPEEGAGEGDRLAAMAITTDTPVAREVVEEIAAGEDFVAGYTVSL
jgi:D-3-phosphoglycerate dehydrogenase